MQRLITLLHQKDCSLVVESFDGCVTTHNQKGGA